MGAAGLTLEVYKRGALDPAVPPALDDRVGLRRHDDRAIFTIANEEELSYEEHPWAIRFALDLRRSCIHVLAFSTR
jgi:hypothetical protein